MTSIIKHMTINTIVKRGNDLIHASGGSGGGGGGGEANLPRPRPFCADFFIFFKADGSPTP